MEHSHAHSFIRYNNCFHTTIPELSICKTDHKDIQDITFKKDARKL